MLPVLFVVKMEGRGCATSKRKKINAKLYIIVWLVKIFCYISFHSAI
jgi:hypothetical protein